LRRISVSSFGYGGTNSHAILDAPSLLPQESKVSTRPRGLASFGGPTDSYPPKSVDHASNGSSYTNGTHTVNGTHPLGIAQVLVLSAKTESSLLRIIDNLRQWLSNQVDMSNYDLVDLAHTLVSHRSVMPWRASFVSTSLNDILSILQSDLDLMPVRSSNLTRTTFIFTGQGAQWFAMGRELMSMLSTYRDSILESTKILKDLGASWNLLEELSKPESISRVNESEIAQPATTAIQIALVSLLRYVGVTPNAVLGHSSGEIAAAYTAGALSHASSITVAYFRGLLSADMAGSKGAMLAVGLGEAEAAEYTKKLSSGVAVVACANSPTSSTVSGDETAIHELKGILDDLSIFARQIQVNVAWHSQHVAAVADIYLSNLKDLNHRPTTPSVTFISSVTGQEKTSDFGPVYWVENLVSKVRFRNALETLCQKQHISGGSDMLSPKEIFIELGPHSVLSGPIRQTIVPLHLRYGYSYLSPLSRNHDAKISLLRFGGGYFQQGGQIDLKTLNKNLLPLQRRRPEVVNTLPPYPWDHSKVYWHESRLSKAHRFREFPYHDLLGTRIVTSTLTSPIWRHVISVDRLPWLRDHVINGFIIFPASGYICMALEAMRQTNFRGGKYPNVSNYFFKDVSFISALTVPDSSQNVEIQMSLARIPGYDSTSPWEEFRVFSVSPGGASVDHCQGLVMLEEKSETQDEVEATREQDLKVAQEKQFMSQTRGRKHTKLDCVAWYAALKARGNDYGATFATFERLGFDKSTTLGVAKIPNVQKYMPGNFQQPHVIHPAILDTILHSALPLFDQHSSIQSGMIVSIGDLRIAGHISNIPETRLTISSRVAAGEDGSFGADISAYQSREDGDEDLVVHMKDAKFLTTGRAKSGKNDGREMVHQIKWDRDVDYVQSSMFKLPEEIVEEGGVSQEQLLKSLSQAAAVFVRACIRDISCGNMPVVPGNNQHHFNWMKRFQASDECNSLLSEISDPVAEESLIAFTRKLGAEGELVCRVGGNLASILTGQVEPLALMMENGLLANVYAQDTSTGRNHAQLVAYVKYLVFKNPNMRVLELGAGTGSATIPLIRALGQENEGELPLEGYDFTDISNGFFERAQNVLHEWDKYIHYRLLDVRKDFVKQGFTPESYDLVIASNVLHVAPDINVVISRVKRLLKPGGRLAVIETTTTFPFYSTCFGVLDGWWAGVDNGRTNAPTQSIEQWNNCFLHNGFNGAEIVAKDYENSTHRGALMITESIGLHDDENGKTMPIKILVESDRTVSDSDWLTKFRAVLVEENIPVSIESLESGTVDPETLYIVVDDSPHSFLTTDNSAIFDQLKSLLVRGTRILWISAQIKLELISDTTRAEKGMVAGFARVARAENELLKLVTVDIQSGTDIDFDATATSLKKLVVDGFYRLPETRSQELEYTLRDGEIFIPRVVPHTSFNQHLPGSVFQSKAKLQPFKQPGQALKLEVEKYGFLDSLKFVNHDILKQPLPDSEIEIEVVALGINFKDVLIALGRLKSTVPMGGEYAGTVTKVGSKLRNKFQVGDRVCGFGATPYASHVRVEGHLAAQMPTSMSFVTGASIPVIFGTAHHALVDIARLRKGQTVLISAAAGGVGLAAVTIAQHVGVEIFAIVGTASKKQLLVNKYGIAEDHIFSSKLRTFKDGILRMTSNKGVDAVLSALSGSAQQDAWACVAPFGVFLEIGKTDGSGLRLDMKPFDRHVTFASIDLTRLAQSRPDMCEDLLSSVMTKFMLGEYTPIQPITTMAISEIEAAFRTMQSRKSTGKLVLEITQDTVVPLRPNKIEPLNLSDNAAYMIAGGLGYLGLALARFLAKHGAKHIVLLSRRTLESTKLQELKDEFLLLGTRLYCFACDVTDLSRFEEVVSICNHEMPPIKGFIMAAMVVFVSYAAPRSEIFLLTLW
jgi:acyl transferase domain-containing protein/NADPH:quinone reductase-like Zn-dependent oxidoreductase/ubiquinone/menaquinone biosynthesis C-methylase UbiE